LYEKLPNPSRDEVVGLFPQIGSGNGGKPYNYAGREYNNKNTSMFNGDKPQAPSNFNDSGSASRFFYCAKASKKERNIGCEGLEEKPKVFNGQSDKPSEDMKDVEKRFTTLPVANFHPTVKPLALMEYLVKLVSRERQVVLDPFMGSGTTGMACVNTGRDFIGIEIDEDYFKIAQARIESCKESRQLTFE
jgi:site-specific DNA-methyltransferase (adenine-specific)